MNLPSVSATDLKGQRVHNHFCNNFVIGNKKTLFQTMSEYYSQEGSEVFDYLPLTFHIKNGLEDD
jgi:tubulin--tyrosine ligase